MENLKQNNIKNLISLWKTVGNSFQQYIQNETLSYCAIPNSEWPNRIWFNEKINESTLEKTIEIIKKSSIPLSVSSWSCLDNETDPTFEKLGFSKKSEQFGMSLKLENKFDEPNRLKFIRVTKSNQVPIWTQLYPISFGYNISGEIINRTKDMIQYYLIYRDQQAIGTAITHITEGIIGIHGMGIIPKFRNQGYAKEVMAYLLNTAIKDNKQFATLQSSPMGKNIYKSIGFKEDFLMTAYNLI